MSESYNQNNKKSFNRDAIIGLGESSFRKNYYPELQEKIMALENINSRNNAIISTIPDILLLSNTNGIINPKKLFEENVDTFSSDLINDPEILSLIKTSVEEASFSDYYITKDFEYKKDNTIYYFEMRIKKSAPDEVLIMIRNMTDRITLEHKLREMLELDHLTNIYNRRKFEDFIHSINKSELELVTAITFDINGLKFINDTLGHLVGDEVLISGANIIFEIFKTYGIVARIGGDEFGIIIIGLPEKEIEKLIGELLEKVREYNKNNQLKSLSFAFGYSFHEKGIIDMELQFRIADNNMLQNKLLMKDSIRGTFVKTFMKALEAKDFISEGHALRMEKMAKLIGNELNLHLDQIDRINLLTKFHDIGKIGIPDSILKKPGPLTSEEWQIMKSHCTIGERIAKESLELQDIAHLILKHQEKWDGTGYPLGLRGAAIPIECRVLAIVDTFDAMTNDRPYRAAMPISEAVDEIKKCKGTQFDPSIVTIFEKIISNFYQ